MSRPPTKAIEQIRRYCEKTQCRRCYYGYEERTGKLDEISYVACKLQMQNPCDWDLPITEQRGCDE